MNITCMDICCEQRAVLRVLLYTLRCAHLVETSRSEMARHFGMRGNERGTPTAFRRAYPI